MDAGPTSNDQTRAEVLPGHNRRFYLKGMSPGADGKLKVAIRSK